MVLDYNWWYQYDLTVFTIYVYERQGMCVHTCTPIYTSVW